MKYRSPLYLDIKQNQKCGNEKAESQQQDQCNAGLVPELKRQRSVLKSWIKIVNKAISAALKGKYVTSCLSRDN